MQPFFTILGTITNIQTNNDCSLTMNVVDTDGGVVNFIVDSSTYVQDMENFSAGDNVLAFCDSSAPAPLIYPPQYRPALLLEPESGSSYDLDTYGNRLTNSQGTLRLQISRSTEITLANGQTYYGPLNGRMLLVEYTASTRSIPAITTPKRITVFCSSIAQ